ncbi:unnamed protein product [Polarella glacialis]|uniref:Cyclic nucleotide-binding domain-containing protein n=1 Tax=Polarella glacialis TaxID=89957 RepID=A0A813I893_POLGL|nr:unnamed protein product [Polarella glacialis]
MQPLQHPHPPPSYSSRPSRSLNSVPWRCRGVSSAAGGYGRRHPDGCGSRSKFPWRAQLVSGVGVAAALAAGGSESPVRSRRSDRPRLLRRLLSRWFGKATTADVSGKGKDLVEENVSAGLPGHEVPDGCVRVENRTDAEIVVLAYTKGELVYLTGEQELVLAPKSQADVRASGSIKVRMAVRRRNDARLFQMKHGDTLTLLTGTDLPGVEDLPEDAAVHVLQDLACVARSASWEVLPGPLFWKLPVNTKDVEFKVGDVLRDPLSSVKLKVVRDEGADWRRYPMARVRVVEGGISRGKLLNKGAMYIAKIVPNQRVLQEIADTHKKLSGLFGPPPQIARCEASFHADSGAWLLLFEDFGESFARMISESSDTLRPEDVDGCAEDLLAALAAMHGALSPESVWLRRDGLGRLRLKLAHLGASEQPSDPLPPKGLGQQLGWQSFLAPELQTSTKRLEAVAQAAAKQTASAVIKIESSQGLGPLKSLELLPPVKPKGGSGAASEQQQQQQQQQQQCQEKRLELLREFPVFAEMSSEELAELAEEFRGPYYVPPGQEIFRSGDVGDFLYFVLEGTVVTRRGSQEIRRYYRGGFVGEASLLGKRPTLRIFTAVALRGGSGCAVLRMGHKSFSRDLKANGPLTGLVAPTRWRYLADADLRLAEPKSADVFAAGALWCQLVAGTKTKSFPVSRIRKMETIEGLRGAVSTRDLGNFYFLLEERRVVTLIELLIRRTSATEALLCLQAVEDPGPAVGQKAPVGHHLVVEGEGEQEAGEVERNKFFWEDMEQAFKSTWKLSETAVVASDALAISTRARANAVQQAVTRPAAHFA